MQIDFVNGDRKATLTTEGSVVIGTTSSYDYLDGGSNPAVVDDEDVAVLKLAEGEPDFDYWLPPGRFSEVVAGRSIVTWKSSAGVSYREAAKEAIFTSVTKTLPNRRFSIIRSSDAGSSGSGVAVIGSGPEDIPFIVGCISAKITGSFERNGTLYEGSDAITDCGSVERACERAGVPFYGSAAATEAARAAGLPVAAGGLSGIVALAVLGGVAAWIPRRRS